MSLDTDKTDVPPHSPSAGLSMGIAIGLSAIYCVVVYMSPATWWPGVVVDVKASILREVYGAIDEVLRIVGASSPSAELRNGIYLVLVAGIVPWLLLATLRRGQPYDLGCRLPNRIGWRLLLIGYLAALPFQYWMVLSPAFSRYYEPHLARAGFFAFAAFYAVNMLAEHFFFHGVLLGVCRVGHRWPSPPPIAVNAQSRWGRFGQWLGLAQPHEGTRGLARAIRWIGLPGGCLAPLVTSAILFGVVHLGKDPREMLLSVPGGLALGYVAYRSNSWLIPYILHLATAGTALGMMMIMG